jgi:hypothetical protein
MATRNGRIAAAFLERALELGYTTGGADSSVRARIASGGIHFGGSRLRLRLRSALGDEVFTIGGRSIYFYRVGRDGTMFSETSRTIAVSNVDAAMAELHRRAALASEPTP